MTPEKTAVKGSYWFIFHGKGDVMNSKLRGTRGRAVYRSGKAATAQAGTSDELCRPGTGFWDRVSGLATFEEGCVCPLQMNII